MTTGAHDDGPSGLTAIVRSSGRSPRARASLGLGELLPRYLLVEGALEGRRVLEVGTTDPRSLLRLLDAGASRVIGTAPDASVFDRSRFSSHEIELFSMDRGRVDLPDDAFDAVLVVDLALELTHNKRFLDEVRRVLSPDGFVLVGFSATGRSLLHLVTDDPSLPELEPARLEAAVRDVFPDARFYVQSPFIGVAIHREGEDPSALDVSLDPTLAGAEARPSHVLALAGDGAPAATDRTLVELPFLDFEALTEASQAKSATDVKRLLNALAEAKKAIGERDKSLTEIGERLPRIKRAFRDKLERARTSKPAHEVISPTVLERPTEDGSPRLTAAMSRLESAREELRTRVDGLSAALDREKEARTKAEANVVEVEARAARLERMLRDADSSLPAPAETEPKERQLEAMHQELERRDLAIQDLRTTVDQKSRELERYQTRVSELQQTIVEQVTVRPEPLADDGNVEADRRIQHLERTASAQEQEIESLRRELSSQLEVRHSMGTDYRDAESRISFLSGRVDEVSIAFSAERQQLEGRVAFLAEALSSSDRAREAQEHRLAELESVEYEIEAARAAAESRAAEAIEAHAESSRMARALADEVDQLRRDAHQRAGRMEALERELLDRTAEARAASGTAVAQSADRRAVEMAAGHLSREVEQLRRRVQELRNERDTLAATSSLLLDERDAAAELAQRAISSEARARQLAESLEGGQAAIERLEREVEAAQDEAETAHRRHLDLLEKNKRLEGELAALNNRMEVAQNDGSANRVRASDLDQKLASLERRLVESLESRDRAVAQRNELEEMLREASMAASDAVREARLWQERNDALEADARRHESEMGTALSRKASAEAEAAEAVWALTRAEAERTKYRAELAMLRQHAVEAAAEAQRQPAADPAELVAAQEAKETAETALGRTLEEAAKLTFRIEDLERELAESQRRVEKAESDREVLDRQRRSAAEGQKNANAAREHAVIESKALADRVNRLEFEQSALIRELEARENDVLRLEASLKQAAERAEPSVPTAPVVTFVPVDAGPDPIAQARQAHNAQELERLRHERTVERTARLDAEEMVGALRAALAIARDRMRALRASNDEGERLAILRTQLLAVDVARQQAEAEVHALRSASAHLTHDVGSLVAGARAVAIAEVEDLEAELAFAHARINDFEAERSAQTIERLASEERPDGDDHDRLTRRLFEAEAAREQAEHQRSILEACATQLERQRDEARAALLALQADGGGSPTQETSSELIAERNTLSKQVAALKTAVESADLDRTALLSEYESLAQARNNALAERSTLEGLLQALAEQQETMERERASIEAELSMLRDATDDHDTALAKLGRERDDALVARENIEADMQVVVAERDAARSELADRTRALSDERDAATAELEDRVRRLDERVAKLNDERVSLQDERASMEERLFALTDERTQIEAAFELAIEERDAARQHRAETTTRLGDLEARLADVQRSVEREKAAAKAALAKAELAALEKLRVAEAGAKAARSAADAAVAERDEARQESEEADRELTDAVARLEAMTNARVELEAKLSDAEDELEAGRSSQGVLEQQQHELEGARAAAEASNREKEALEERLEAITEAQRQEAMRFAKTTGERDTLRAVVEAARDEGNELRAKITSLETSLETEQQTAHDRVSRIAQTAGERDALKAEVAELRLRAENEQARAEAGWREAQELEERRQALENELASARDVASSSDPSMLATATKRAGEAELKLEKAASNAKRLRKELDETKLVLAQLEADKENAESALMRREAQIEKERADAKRAVDKARHAEAYTKESETRARELESKRKKLETRALEAEGRAEHAERQRRSLELEVQQIETRLQTRLEDAEARARSLTDQRADLESARHRAEARVSELERALSGKSRVELEESLRVATARLVELESSSASSADADALRGRIRNLERAVADRDGEAKRLRALADRAARELDEARAEVGRKLSEIRQGREGLDFVRRQLAQARTDSDALRVRLDRSGDAQELREQLDARDQQIAQLTAEAAALESERHRLHTTASSTEAAQVQYDRRITELEMGLDDRDRRLERLTRELADKTERLRRLSGLPEG